MQYSEWWNKMPANSHIRNTIEDIECMKQIEKYNCFVKSAIRKKRFMNYS